MMQHEERVACRRFSERPIEAQQFRRSEHAFGVTEEAGVEHHDPPAAEIPVAEIPVAEIVVSAVVEGFRRQRATHGRRIVMVTRYAEHRSAATPEFLAYPAIACRVVVRHIAREQQCIGRLLQRLGEHRPQRRERLDTALLRMRISLEMRIGDLQKTQGGHAADRSVMPALLSERSAVPSGSRQYR